MASNTVKSNRMKRMESRKSHSWWWDSHISPKNSKWLQENLEEMDLRVKEMLKLIEEDADSFAKKAEMYYQKRPELITLVEDFYRMYRSLAERYDHVTGELRKNIPSDLQSQGSGVSDVGSEPPSTMPSPDRRSSYRKPGNRAAGFDYFLGGNGSDLYNKEGDESSTLDSESETDDSFGNNNSVTHGNDDEHRLRQRVIELEAELCEVKEKLLMREEEFLEGYFRNYGDGNYEVLDKMAKYEEEISNLKIEIQKYKSLGEIDDPVVLDSSVDAYSLHKIRTLEEELRIAQQKLHESEEEVMRKGSDIQNLQEQLKSAKNELEKESGEVSKLHERVASYKTNLAARDVEIRGLKEAISNANKSLSEENEQLQREISRLAQERAYLEDNLKGLDVRFRVLEEELRRANEGRAEMETTFTSRINQLKDEIENKNECMGELKKALDALQAKHNALLIERDELNADASDLSRELSFKDDRIDQMSRHLHQLHMEHVDLIAGAEGARRSAEELKSRIKELEREVEKKERIIVQGAEEKREAIRQLCFSLEHYRNGYHRLREVVTGQKSVVAT